MKETQLFLVRHGETSYNAEKRFQGHEDTLLSEQGIAQAQKLSDYLSDVHIDGIFASDLSRAAQTAEYIAQKQGLQVEKYKELRERYYGEWQGYSFTQIAEKYPDHVEVRHQGGFYGIESFNDLQQRVVQILTTLARQHLGKAILVVSHGGCINAFLHWVTNGRLGPGVTTIKNTSLSRLIFRETEAWELIDVNQTIHLVE